MFSSKATPIAMEPVEILQREGLNVVIKFESLEHENKGGKVKIRFPSGQEGSWQDVLGADRLLRLPNGLDLELSFGC